MTDLTPAVVVVNTDTGATTTIELDAGTTDTIDVVVAGTAVVEVTTGGGEPGPPGPPGVVVSDTPPVDTDVMWADTGTVGSTLVQTVQAFIYTDESDTRPAVTFCIWVPDPVTLGNPFGALEGDIVLRTSENPVQGLNGIDGLWKGTAAEYEALSTYDESVVYYVIEAP
jgi:hypothetical protein